MTVRIYQKNKGHFDTLRFTTDCYPEVNTVKFQDQSAVIFFKDYNKTPMLVPLHEGITIEAQEGD